MSDRSSLYIGAVMHHRVRPKPHRLRYRMFWLFLDLDEIDALDGRLRLFSHNRFNAVSFHDADHGEGGGRPLRAQVEHRLAEAGLALDGGAIRLLCMPRILGYGFNPLSIFFCYDRSGRLSALIYEVHNTFRERHSYLATLEDSAAGDLRHTGEKRFYVSPFMDMDMTYRFRVSPPHERIAVAIHADDEAGPLLTAALSGQRTALTDRSLARVLVTHPFLTLKVIAAIHWHAMRLWWKGIPLRAHPRQPDRPVTAIRTHR